MMVVDDPEFCPDPSAQRHRHRSLSWRAYNSEAAARNSSMRPSWAINENGKMVDEL